MITPEQNDSLNQDPAIPFEQMWKAFGILDTLHTFCGGPIPTLEAQCLDSFSIFR